MFLLKVVARLPARHREDEGLVLGEAPPVVFDERKFRQAVKVRLAGAGLLVTVCEVMRYDGAQLGRKLPATPDAPVRRARPSCLKGEVFNRKQPVVAVDRVSVTGAHGLTT